MEFIDLGALRSVEPRRDPCSFVVVPRFVFPEALVELNRLFPAIGEPGNFEPERLDIAPRFREFLEELHSDELRDILAGKFDIDLSGLKLQLTLRRLSAASDGNAHNDSRNKLVTVLVYLNETWDSDRGCLRMLTSRWNLDGYVAEVPPKEGNMIAFRRNERSFHGFRPFVGERRSLQMYWVKPKRPGDAEKRLGLKKLFKRMIKHRPRIGA